VNCQIHPGAARTQFADAQRAGVTHSDRFRRLSAAAFLSLSVALVGCGSSSDLVNVTSNEAPEPATPAPTDAVSAGDGNADSNDANSNEEGASYESSSPGADVLLVIPAGSAALPVARTPDIQFTNLAISSNQTLEATLRAASRNPVTADGGRSGTLSTGLEGQTGSVTVSWDPPLQNADSSSIADLAGYRVYQGDSEQLSIVQELNETGAGERRLTQINNVTSENSCFAVTAFDTSANESALGDVVCKDVIVATPTTNTRTPNLTSVTQLNSTDGVANVRLTWNAPAQASGGAGSTIALYSIYHGSQSQLFKIREVLPSAAQTGSNLQYDVPGIDGAQACFALTARYSDGHETILGEIVCVPLTHNAAPQPGDQLRPFNVTAVMVGAGTAEVSWDRPNTVVSSADATGIDRYDLYQGSRSQVYKVDEVNESGAAGSRRTTTASNVFAGSNCFALTATDESRRQSALSTIVCASPSVTGSSNPSAPVAAPETIGVTNITALETSPGSVAISWDAPELVAAGQAISNLAGYNLYQGSESQLFKVAEQSHVSGVVRQQIQRQGVTSNNACFAVTAYDRNGFEAPLSAVRCAEMSGTASVPAFGIVPPTDLATSALGGSTTVTLSWLASGAAATGAADPNVHLYNIYQGNHDRLFKVRQVNESHASDPRSSVKFTGVTPGSSCFAITAQYRDLRESRLSGIVCRDN